MKQRKQKPRSRGKTVGRWIAWLSVITLAEIFVFHHYNVQLSTTQVPVDTKQTTANPTPAFHIIKDIGPHELRAKLFGLSPDGTKFAYVDADNDFYIVDTQSGKVLTHVNLGYKADYIEWFDNSHLFVGTENPLSSGLKNIRFSTYDLSSNSFHLWQVYTGYRQTASLENVTFSPFTNDTYILLGDSSGSVEYHFDTNNNMWHYNLSGRVVQDWLVSQTSDQLYYQDVENNVPDLWVYDYRTTSSHSVAQDAKLLSMDSNTLYYANLNSANDVTSIRSVTDWNKGSQKVLALKTPVPFSDLFATGKTFYRIGSTTMTNLQTGKQVKLPQHQQTLVSNGTLFVMGTNGSVYYYSPATTSQGAAGNTAANSSNGTASNNTTG